MFIAIGITFDKVEEDTTYIILFILYVGYCIYIFNLKERENE